MEINHTLGLSLCFKLINTLNSKSFRKSLVTLWHGAASSENIFAVNNKACKDLQRKIDMFERHDDISIAYNYLESLCSEQGIGIKAADKKGLIRDFTLDTYSEVSRFLMGFSSTVKPYGQMQYAQFETHELLWSLLDYLLIKDSVEKGTGHNKLDSLIQKFFKTKPKDFFERGYIGDLFVSDRLALHQRPSECHQIMCKRDYLSTLMVAKGQSGSNDSQYINYTVA